jgi:hypothetical protein
MGRGRGRGRGRGLGRNIPRDMEVVAAENAGAASAAAGNVERVRVGAGSEHDPHEIPEDDLEFFRLNRRLRSSFDAASVMHGNAEAPSHRRAVEELGGSARGPRRRRRGRGGAGVVPPPAEQYSPFALMLEIFDNPEEHILDEIFAPLQDIQLAIQDHPFFAIIPRRVRDLFVEDIEELRQILRDPARFREAKDTYGHIIWGMNNAMAQYGGPRVG